MKRYESAKLLYASPAANSDVFWATKFSAPDEFVFAEWQGKKYMVASALEYERAREEAEVDKVFLDANVWKDAETRTTANVIVKFLEKLGVREVEIPSGFPASLYAELEEKNLKLYLKKPPFFPERAVKTPEEIADIKFVQNATEKAFGKIKRILAAAKIRKNKIILKGETVTSEMLKGIFDVELARSGCATEGTIFASGEQAVAPHNEGSGPIIPNTLIVCDMFPRSKKKCYWSDMTRMLVKGKATSEMKKMFEAVRSAQEQARKMVRPGVDGHEIHKFVSEFFAKNGWKNKKTGGKLAGFLHGTGHGVGLDIHEPPRISLVKNQILRAGNVITIEPGLYYPGLGGCRIEDTILVTENGCENLAAKCPKELYEL